MSSGMDLELVKRVAVRAAFRSGKILRAHLGRIQKVDKKGAIDLVTEADLASEQAILETIRTVFPDHAILAEESGLADGHDEYQWIVDPLDGTTNFAHELGLFSTSIAFALNGKPVVGVVLNPVSGELFTAADGESAELNGEPIRVSATRQVADSLLVTGFPYNLKEIIGILMKRFTACIQASRGVRRLGSAALDLCFVACGRFDGFWEQNLKPWDTAAGLVIARAAGAMVTDFANVPFTVDKPEILATNGHIHSELISLLE